MKLKALTDIRISNKEYKAGSIFEIGEDKAGVLFEYGWAEKVVEEVKAPKEEKAPKAKASKKTTKK